MVTGLDCASATPLAYDVWQSHNHYVTPWMDDPAYMCVVGLFCRVSSSVSSGFVVVDCVDFRRRRWGEPWRAEEAWRARGERVGPATRRVALCARARVFNL